MYILVVATNGAAAQEVSVMSTGLRKHFPSPCTYALAEDLHAGMHGQNRD